MISKQIEEKIKGILEEYRIKGPPVPVEEIAQKCGIKIGRAPSDDFAGFLLRKEESSFIGVNSNDPNPRQRCFCPLPPRGAEGQ